MIASVEEQYPSSAFPIYDDCNGKRLAVARIDELRLFVNQVDGNDSWSGTKVLLIFLLLYL